MQSVSVSLGVLVMEKKRAVMTHLDRQSCRDLENCFRDSFYNIISVSCRTRGFQVGGAHCFMDMGFPDIITMPTYFDHASHQKNEIVPLII